MRELAENATTTAQAFQLLYRTGRADLIELCCVEPSKLSPAVTDTGGVAMRCGLFNGFDLGTNKGLLRAKHLINTWKPRALHGSPPCTYHTTMQNANQRTDEQTAYQLRGRKWATRIMREVIWLLRYARDKYATIISFEHPAGATSWQQVPERGNNTWMHVGTSRSVHRRVGQEIMEIHRFRDWTMQCHHSTL